jgi:hypothetical protein
VPREGIAGTPEKHAKTKTSNLLLNCYDEHLERSFQDGSNDINNINIRGFIKS